MASEGMDAPVPVRPNLEPCVRLYDNACTNVVQWICYKMCWLFLCIGQVVWRPLDMTHYIRPTCALRRQVSVDGDNFWTLLMLESVIGTDAIKASQKT